MKNKPIIDVCCGGRMFYFDKADPRVHFCDIRDEDIILCDGRTYSVRPDTVADFTALPFEDNTYYCVIFDPPHLRTASDKSWLVKKYGKLPKENLEAYLRDGFAECFRVLRPGGTLIFKWSEHDIPLNWVLKLSNQNPVIKHSKDKTHFVVFIKDLETKENMG